MAYPDISLMVYSHASFSNLQVSVSHGKPGSCRVLMLLSVLPIHTCRPTSMGSKSGKPAILLVHRAILLSCCFILLRWYAFHSSHDSASHDELCSCLLHSMSDLSCSRFPAANLARTNPTMLAAHTLLHLTSACTTGQTTW